MTDSWRTISAQVVRGHRVASGSNGDSRFPGGTIRMQTPFFRALGLDLSSFFTGTLNASIAPLRYHIVRPRHTLRGVRWHPTQPPEDFSFIEMQLLLDQQTPIAGWIYYPHPETKPEHFQNPDVLELLLPHVEGLVVGTRIDIRAPAAQIHFEPT